MHKVAGSLLLALWATLVSAQTSPSCKPAPKPDWERDGLRGAVQKVLTFETWFRRDEKSRVITKTTKLEEEATYDSTGRRTYWRNFDHLPVDPKDELIVEYGCDSTNRIAEIRYKRLRDSSFRKTVYRYDEKGRDREKADYFADNTLERLEKYSYDESGNLIEVISKQQSHPEHFRPRRYDVYVTTKITYGYDGNGNRASETHFYPDGSLYATWTFKYDSENRLLKDTRTDKLGRLEDQYIYKHNRKGQVIEEKHYANFCYQRDGKMCEGSVNSADGIFYYLTKTTYEYDRIGNWIRQKQFSMGGEKNTRRYELDRILSRQISYYRQPL